MGSPEEPSLWHALLCGACGFESSLPTERVPATCPKCGTASIANDGDLAIWPPMPLKERAL